MGADAKDRDREVVFMSIDRSEYVSLSDYIKTKEIKVKNLPDAASAAYGGKARMGGGMEEGEGEDSAEDDEDGSEDDGDYNSGESSHSERDSDDSGTDEGSDNDGDGEAPKEKERSAEKPVRENYILTGFVVSFNLCRTCWSYYHFLLEEEQQGEEGREA